MNAKQTALDAYLARTAAIHAKLERLQQLADDYFCHDRDAIHWGSMAASQVEMHMYPPVILPIWN